MQAFVLVSFIITFHTFNAFAMKAPKPIRSKQVATSPSPAKSSDLGTKSRTVPKKELQTLETIFQNIYEKHECNSTDEDRLKHMDKAKEFRDYIIGLQAMCLITQLEGEINRQTLTQVQANPNAPKVSSAKKGKKAKPTNDSNSSKSALPSLSKTKLNSIFVYLDILNREFPFSPWAIDLDKIMARADLLHASSSFIDGNHQSAESYFNRAFFRLKEGAELRIAPFNEIKFFAQNCRKTPSQTCDYWLSKLNRIYPKTSSEEKELETILNTDLSAFADEKGDRISPKLFQTYKTLNEDYTAIQNAIDFLTSNQKDKAREAFEKFLIDFPKSQSRSRAKYWLARLFNEDGNESNARALYHQVILEAPLTYYAILANFDLKKMPATNPPEPSLTGRFSAILPKSSQTDRHLGPFEIVAIQRVETFLQHNFTNLASFELQKLNSKSSYSDAFLYYLADLETNAHAHSRAFVTLTELISRGRNELFSSIGLRQVFPLTYLGLADKHATVNGIDPLIVLGLMKQESAFDKSILSHVGATGMMQLMPTTALDVDPSVRLSDLIDADTNARIGTKYLKTLLDQSKKNVMLSLASYNAGPGASSKWIQAYREKNFTDYRLFIELISYKETREYVASILRNIYWYTWKSRGQELETFDDFFQTN